MEMERVDEHIYDLTGQIAAGGIIEVTLGAGAAGSRTVAELMHGVAVGSFVAEGAAVMLTSLNNNRFTIEASFPQVLDFIGINQNADVVIGTERLTGRTTRIVPEGGRNTVTIEVSSGSLRGGEMASVTVSGGSTNHPRIVPLSALREDQNGYFILFAEAVSQRRGSNYFLRALRVEPGRRDVANVAVSPSWGMDFPEEPVVVNSDMPVRAGDRVRIVGDLTQ
jgi:hypothetical protein